MSYICRIYGFLVVGLLGNLMTANALTIFEGGENGLTNVTVQVPSGFNVINSRFAADAPPHSFRFHNAGFTPVSKSVRLNPSFVASGSSEVRFKSMLGLCDNGEMAVVQVSSDSGLTWNSIYTQTGNGSSGETSFQQRAVSLASYAGQSLQLRFLYAYTSGSWFWQDWEGVNGQNSGWYVDQIEVRNVEIGASATAPIISQHPQNQTVTEGGTTTFIVTASGTATLTYQWLKNGTPISGANGTSLTLSNVAVSGGGNYHVAVTNSVGTAYSNPASLTVQVAIAPMDAWRNLHFTPAQLANPAISGPQADPDGDGLTNLVEYGLLLDPSVRDDHAAPAVSIGGTGNQRFLQIAFRRNRAAVDIDFVVEVANNLGGPWMSGSEYTEVVSVTDNGDGSDTVVVKDRLILGGAVSRFMRAKFQVAVGG